MRLDVRAMLEILIAVASDAGSWVVVLPESAGHEATTDLLFPDPCSVVQSHSSLGLLVLDKYAIGGISNE
jgi:hypothetical protein